MRRREFIVGLGGLIAAPFMAHGQERLRRIGVLMSADQNDPEMQSLIAALTQGLQDVGWRVGRNLQLELRSSGGDLTRLRNDAADLIAQKPEVIVAGMGPTPAILHVLTRTTPVVFAQAVDPVGGGFVNSLARPGGNMTGFTQFEYGLSAKWLELLREIAPQVSRVGVVRELSGPVAYGQWAVIQTFASSMNVEVAPINLKEASETDVALAGFAPAANHGMIVVVGAIAAIQRDLIVSYAARQRLPAIYYNRLFVQAGGLMSYGPNLANGYRRAASYVDRILKGEKPADLPVQAPTKYELVINLKTAKALALTVPPSLLARADEVIE